jgi:hypothetical protein
MIGLDAKIDIVKTRFQSKLFTGITGNTYVSYGRAFITKRKDKEGRVIDVPELQLPSGVKYYEVLQNRNIDGHSFFLAESKIEVIASDLLRTKVEIYFSVNLDILYPTIAERAVEYLHRDVLKILDDYSFELKDIDPENAFKRFGFIKETDNMEPYYLVRFDTEIEYRQNCTT